MNKILKALPIKLVKPFGFALLMLGMWLTFGVIFEHLTPNSEERDNQHYSENFDRLHELYLSIEPYTTLNEEQLRSNEYDLEMILSIQKLNESFRQEKEPTYLTLFSYILGMYLLGIGLRIMANTENKAEVAFPEEQ